MWSQFNFQFVICILNCGRLEWIKMEDEIHIIRRDENINIRQIIGKSTRRNQTRPKGRPMKQWWDEVRMNMRTADVKEEDATDQIKWRQTCGEAKYRLEYKWPWK